MDESLRFWLGLGAGFIIGCFWMALVIGTIILSKRRKVNELSTLRDKIL